MAVNNPTNPLVISYLQLRIGIGLIGLLLPFVLAIGTYLLTGTGIKPSISDYYYSPMSGVFVGCLWSIGMLMFVYRGPNLLDVWVGHLAGICAIGVSLFPTTPNNLPTDTIGALHYTCAVLFFIMLAYFCLVLFTKTDPTKQMTVRKRYRNKVYIACGVTITTCIIMIAVYKLFLLNIFPLSTVFWFESIAVVAFGLSWVTKGEAILQDV